MSVNKVILVGRLGKEPETRYTTSGSAVCNFSVATDESYKDKQGERQKKTEWHRIVVWNKLAEICQQYLKKGSLVYLEGKLQTRDWEDREGKKRQSVEVVVNNMKMLGSKPNGGESRLDEPSEETAMAPEQPASKEIDDSDVPF